MRASGSENAINYEYAHYGWLSKTLDKRIDDMLGTLIGTLN